MWLKQHCISVQGLQYAFLSAAYEGDLDKVKDLIGQGCPVSTTNQVKFALAHIHHKAYIRTMFPYIEHSILPHSPHAHAHTHHNSVRHLHSHCDLVA